jgi:hypothetical protein
VQAITTRDQRALDEAEAALAAFLRAASPRASTPAAVVKLAARVASATPATRPTGATGEPLARAARGPER